MQKFNFKTRSSSDFNSFINRKQKETEQTKNKPRLSVLSTPKRYSNIVKQPATASSATESLKSDLTYNKWFIHPSRRMKPSCSFKHIDKKQETFVYRQLYQEKYPDPDCPFKQKISEKMKLLDVLPQTNIRCLQGFQKIQLKKRKRVPQIVEMLLEKVKELSKNKL